MSPYKVFTGEFATQHLNDFIETTGIYITNYFESNLAGTSNHIITIYYNGGYNICHES